MINYNVESYIIFITDYDRQRWYNIVYVENFHSEFECVLRLCYAVASCYEQYFAQFIDLFVYTKH